MQVAHGHPPLLARVRPTQVLLALLALDTLILAGYVISRVVVWNAELSPFRTRIAQLFDLDQEAAVPTAFASAQLLAASLLFAVVAGHAYAERSRWRGYWAGLSVVLAYIWLDELANIHELLVEPVGRILALSGGPLWIGWVIPATAVLLVLGLIYLRFLLALPPATRIRLAFAAATAAGGAIGIEIVYSASYRLLHEWGAFGAQVEDALVAMEEGLELAGISLLIYALLCHLRDSVARPGVLFAVSASPAGSVGDAQQQVTG